MAIKRIQLRGISRTPSDRLTDDGGCAESLNVQLDNTEIAPSFMPEDVTASLGLPEGLEAEKVFIHKTSSYENIICVVYDDGDLSIQAFIGGKKSIIAYLEPRETVESITSLGNTLVVSGQENKRYFLFKEGSYKALGSQIPFPAIKFTPKYYKEKSLSVNERKSFTIEGNSQTGSKDNYWLSQGEYTKDIWNATNASVEDDPENNLGTQAVNKVCNELAKQLYSMAEENKVFIDQVFVRYAVTLYDNSVLSSIPYLMPGGFENPFLLRYRKQSYYWFKTMSEEYPLPGVQEVYKHTNYEEVLCKAKYPYQIEAQLLTSMEVFDEWKDLIKSIDIFVSEKKTPDFDRLHATTCEVQGSGEYAPYYNLGLAPMGSGQVLDYYEGLQETKTNLLLAIGGPEYNKDFEGRLVDDRLFYRIEHISYKTEDDMGFSSFTKRIKELQEGTLLDTSLYFGDYDALVAEGQILSNDDMIHSEFTWLHADAFNNSIIISGISEYLGRGSEVMPCPAVDIEAMRAIAPNVSQDNTFSSTVPYWVPNDYSVTGPLRFHYIVEDNSGRLVVQGKDHRGESVFVDQSLSFYGWLVFPHKNCKKVIVDDGTGYGREFTMKPHPYLNCSYLYLKLEDNIVTIVGDMGDDIELPTESRRAGRDNRVFQTNIDNPFAFPLDKRYTFQASVVGTAVATVPMSQGQFGEFPLYVFTKEGIWVMQTNDEGSFVSTKPGPRDVCINADSITPLNNAVVFVSAQGVMLLQGAQVVNISPFMNGRHYVVENSPRTIIEQQDFFCDLLPALSDNTHFLAFVKEAKVAYDHAGQRLIFIKKDEKYQYIYKLDTQTWHKAAHGVNLIAPINSYPECLIQADEGGYTKVYDFTTLLDAAQSEISTRGVIATRPFDLGEPDILKTITDVRIRGQFEKGAVKFILLGSNDGFNFQTINTLRGRAWKLFRIIILADLKPTERISWIDVAYDRKFTNRLR